MHARLHSLAERKTKRCNLVCTEACLLEVLKGECEAHGEHEESKQTCKQATAAPSY